MYVWVFECVCARMCGKACLFWVFFSAGFAFLLLKQSKKSEWHQRVWKTTPYGFIHFHLGQKACHSDALLLSSSRCLAELWATFEGYPPEKILSTLCLVSSQTLSTTLTPMQLPNSAQLLVFLHMDANEAPCTLIRRPISNPVNNTMAHCGWIP